MSVKDQLEQSHVDGSHTTVKSKRSTNTGVVSQFNKEAAWQVQQYGDYAGTSAIFAAFVLFVLRLGVFHLVACRSLAFKG